MFSKLSTVHCVFSLHVFISNVQHFNIVLFAKKCNCLFVDHTISILTCPCVFVPFVYNFVNFKKHKHITHVYLLDFQLSFFHFVFCCFHSFIKKKQHIGCSCVCIFSKFHENINNTKQTKLSNKQHVNFSNYTARLLFGSTKHVRL